MGTKERPCKHCNKLFIAPYSLYCSNKCRRLDQGKCSNGHELIGDNIYTHNNKIYCRLCRKQSLKRRDEKMIKKICVICSSEFETKKFGRTESCSSECYNKLLSFRVRKRPMLSKNISEYSIWADVKKRCYNKNSIAYKNYGGRGIKMCDSWFGSFDSFYADMGPRPSEKHEIDRINNNGNYEPGNCRWTTRFINGVNKRFKSGSTGVVGVREVKKNKIFTGKYLSTIRRKGKSYILGTFDSINNAAAARNNWIETYEHIILGERITR